MGLLWVKNKLDCMQITQILNELTYSYRVDDNKITFTGDVWVEQVKRVFDENNVKYSWGFEFGKVVFYIGNVENEN